MSDFVAIDLQGDEQLKKYLTALPPAVQDTVTEDVADYMIDVLRLNPPQKYVTRKAAYGVTFFTDKQRKWFFWALGTGKIDVPYRRTQGQARGWQKIGKGAKVLVANETPGVLFTRDNERQSRHEKLVGWKTVGDEITGRINRIREIIAGSAKKALAKAKGGL